MADFSAFSPAERTVLDSIIRSRRTCTRVSRDDPAAAGLVDTGWLAYWDELHPDHVRITFTPLGAEALGLALSGSPVRWRPIGAKPEPVRASNGLIVLAGSMGEGFDLDNIAGPAQPMPDLDATLGFVLHNGARVYRRPTLVVGVGETWKTARTGDECGAPCPVCVTGKALRPGHYCIACDRYFMVGADGPDSGTTPRLRKGGSRAKPKPVKEAVKVPTRRDRRQAARAA